MLDLRASSDHSGSWLCKKCNTWIDIERPKCSFCGAAREAAIAEASPNPEDVKLTRALHDAIERMNYGQKVKTWRWLEDNII